MISFQRVWLDHVSQEAGSAEPEVLAVDLELVAIGVDPSVNLVADRCAHGPILVFSVPRRVGVELQKQVQRHDAELNNALAVDFREVEAVLGMVGAGSTELGRERGSKVEDNIDVLGEGKAAVQQGVAERNRGALLGGVLENLPLRGVDLGRRPDDVALPRGFRRPLRPNLQTRHVIVQIRLEVDAPEIALLPLVVLIIALLLVLVVELGLEAITLSLR
mmetsp:Transcript_140597/g.449429  ORF Transcript_140597/g.449429 Transcript_140597/m.449429 type:complete len:219 (+) Transcript_140597:240-896(+)